MIGLLFLGSAAGLVGGFADRAAPRRVAAPRADESYNGDLIAGAMTAGLWGGFGP